MSDMPFKKKQSSSGSTAGEEEYLEVVKAAAWAWHKHGHRNGAPAVKECNRHLARHSAAYRPSRFWLEAYADQKHDDSTVTSKSRRHLFDSYHISESICSELDGRRNIYEDENLNGPVCNLDNKYWDGRNGWDFGKSLMDSYEIVAISKHVENYAPLTMCLPRRSEGFGDLRTAAAGSDGKGTASHFRLLPSDNNTYVCGSIPRKAGDLEIGVDQKQRSTKFSLKALSRLKSLAYFQFTRLHRHDQKHLQHRRGYHHRYRIWDVSQGCLQVAPGST